MAVAPPCYITCSCMLVPSLIKWLHTKVRVCVAVLCAMYGMRCDAHSIAFIFTLVFCNTLFLFPHIRLLRESKSVRNKCADESTTPTLLRAENGVNGVKGVKKSLIYAKPKRCICTVSVWMNTYITHEKGLGFGHISVFHSHIVLFHNA